MLIAQIEKENIKRHRKKDQTFQLPEKVERISVKPNIQLNV